MDGRKAAVTYRAAFFLTYYGEKLTREERRKVAAILRELRSEKVELTALVE